MKGQLRPNDAPKGPNCEGAERQELVLHGRSRGRDMWTGLRMRNMPSERGGAGGGDGKQQVRCAGAAHWPTSRVRPGKWDVVGTCWNKLYGNKS